MDIVKFKIFGSIKIRKIKTLEKQTRKYTSKMARTPRNYTLELPTFGVIARVNPIEVQ